MDSMVFLTAAGENIIQEGLVNMLIGLLVVFSVLAFLCLIIWAFKFINKAQGKPETITAAAGAPAPKKAGESDNTAMPAPAVKTPGTMKDLEVDIEGGIDADTAAVILGATAQECGGDFKVTSIKKSK